MLYQKFQNRSKISSILIRGASWSLITVTLGIGFFFGAHVLLARLAGPKSYGNYLYALTVVNFIALLCKLGLDTASIRFIPSYIVRSEWGLLSGFLRRIKQISLLNSMSCAALTAIVIFFISNHIEGELANTFVMACMVIPVTVMLQIYASNLRALKNIVLSEIPQQIIRPMVLVFITILVFAVIGLAPQAPTIIIIECTSIVIALFVSIYFLRKSLPLPVLGVQPKYETKIWIKTAVPLSLMDSSLIIMKQSDIVMVGFILGTTQAGIYGVTTRVAMLLGFGLQSVNKIAAPIFSELYTQGKMKKLQRMVSLAACWSLVISILAGIILIAFGKFILGLFGTTFVEGYVALLILLIGHTINAFAGSSGILMAMTGHQKKAAQILIVGVISNILLNIVLIPTMGITGAAVSTSFATALWNIVMLVYVRKKLEIDSTVISLVRFRV